MKILERTPENVINNVSWFEGFCYCQHDEICNQKYADNLPYSFHLSMVQAQAEKFLGLINQISDGNTAYWRAVVLAGCVGHDLIEDARISFNDIKNQMGEDVAEVIFLCTEMRGRNRAERKNPQFYEELSKNKLAVFVKLCDIMANSLYSVLSNSGMLVKATTEWPNIKSKLLPEHPEFAIMFDYLDRIYKLTLA